MDKEIIWLIGIIGLTALIFDAIILGTIISTRRKINAMKNWPSIKGTVISSAIEQRASNNNRNQVNYPVVNYSYQVDGNIYQGDRIAPGYEVGGSGAIKVIKKYPVGEQVIVFYNPQNPSEAVLERKAPAQAGMWSVFVILNIMLAAMVVLFTRGS